MEELIKEIEEAIETCEVQDQDLDIKSWQYEEGVLISANQARMIVEFYHKLNLAE